MMATNLITSEATGTAPIRDVGNVDQLIRESYYLDEILDVSPIPSRQHRLLTTSRGKFLLKALPYPFQLRRIVYDAAFTDYLSGKGFPARRVVKTRHGELFINVESNAFCLIEYFDAAFQPSSTKTLSEQQIVAAAVRLAELHRYAVDYQGSSECRLPFRQSRSLELFEKISSVIRTRGIQNDFDKLALAAIEKKAQAVTLRPFEGQEFMKGQSILNHGDYHSGNVVFDNENRIVAVLDFEYCTKMPRIWDIAWAMSWLSRRRATEAFSGEIDLFRAKTFLSAYNRAFPLFQQDRLRLRDLFITSCYHTTFLLEHHYLKGHLDCSIEKPHSLEEWLWCVDHRDELEHLILSSH
jgi:Ser/Thr protein kinase RdoA (MazF antagonist)